MKPSVRRLLRSGAVVTALLFAGLGTASCVVRQVAVHQAKRDFPPPGRLIDIEGRLQHIHCIGTGSPTILLESGLDDRGSSSWARVQQELAGISRACSYDRAGLLWSEPADEPRDAERIATELHALLAAASEAPPYVMAGHSLGGLYVRVYDSQYPGEVAGFVLVDPAHPEQEARFPAELRERTREAVANNPPRWLLRVLAPYRIFAPERPSPRTAYWWRSFPEGVLGEVAAIDTTFAQASRTGFLDDRPLIVLTSGVKPELPGLSPEANQAFRRTLMELHAELADLSTSSTHRVVDGAGHYIHVDRPAVVIDAIRDVVMSVREKGRGE